MKSKTTHKIQLFSRTSFFTILICILPQQVKCVTVKQEFSIRLEENDDEIISTEQPTYKQLLCTIKRWSHTSIKPHIFIPKEKDNKKKNLSHKQATNKASRWKWKSLPSLLVSRPSRHQSFPQHNISRSPPSSYLLFSASFWVSFFYFLCHPLL